MLTGMALQIGVEQTHSPSDGKKKTLVVAPEVEAGRGRSRRRQVIGGQWEWAAAEWSAAVWTGLLAGLERGDGFGKERGFPNSDWAASVVGLG